MAMSMTDEEARALDEEFTNGTLRLGTGTGPTMRRRLQTNRVERRKAQPFPSSVRDCVRSPLAYQKDLP